MTPITDRIEAAIESEGKRDVPVRLYHQMRVFEAALRELHDAVEARADVGKRRQLAISPRMENALAAAREALK
jgi:hypothetical protein